MRINVFESLFTSFRGNILFVFFTGEHYRAPLCGIHRTGRSGLSALRNLKLLKNNQKMTKYIIVKLFILSDLHRIQLYFVNIDNL